jgi:hypothetical protein
MANTPSSRENYDPRHISWPYQLPAGAARQQKGKNKI